MSLFRPAENTSAYLKMGLLGFAGSGKTKTATLTAIGLVLYARSKNIEYANKPVFFLDTETGSDWVKPDFEQAGVGLYVAKTRAFVDLLEAVKEAQANGSLLLIDSISHFWKELCDSYTATKARQFNKPTYRLQFQDWGYLKGEWSKFTDAFINSPLHIVLAGRAGYEYDYFENDDGKKELEKTGIKMKAEGEMGYEPSLLVVMERQQKLEGGSVTSTWREATVIKDRSMLLDGKVFTFAPQEGEDKDVMPLVRRTFQVFRPHIECLNLGGKQLGVDTQRTSEHTIPADAPRDKTAIQRSIVIDKIDDLMLRHDAAGTGKDAQKKRSELQQKHFGTVSKTEIEELMPLDKLRTGYDSLHRDLEGKPSEFAKPAQAKPAIDDSLPDHSAPPAQPQPQLTLRDKLCAQIAMLNTMDACLEWSLNMSATYGDLPTEDAAVVSRTLMARQKVLAQAALDPETATENPKPPRPRKNGTARGDANILAAG